jgi:hypothetical protein
MRCLIYAKSKDTAWLKDYFPDVEAYLLKIVNKPLLEYAMDFVSLLDVSEIRIVSDGSTKAIESFIGDGAKWGVKTSFSLAYPNDSLKTVYLKNYSFCKDDDLLLWNGFFFLQYDRGQISLEKEFTGKFYTKDKRFIYLPRGLKLADLSAEDVLENRSFVSHNISNILEYYELSMSILAKHNQKYVLPGYSNDKDTFFGYNLIYPHSSELHPPIMIGNDCHFQRNTLVGPCSIIGNNVIIDENTCVNDSIVYDNTYIGRDLDLDHKIVYKSNLINALNGELIHITDRVLVSQVELGIVTTYFNRCVQRILALLLCAIMLVPWLILFLPYTIFISGLRCERLLNRNMKTKTFTDAEKLRGSLWGRMLLRLSLDKFDQVFAAAITGTIYLVGNRLLTNTVKHRKVIMDLPVYNPGAFSLAESVKADDMEAELFYELEYIDRISTHYNIKILVRSLFRRLVYGCPTIE